MWSNSMLKKNGWQSVKSHFPTALGVIVMWAILTVVGSYIGAIPPSILRIVIGITDMTDLQVILTLATYLVQLACTFLVYAYFTAILECGKCRYFYEARTGNTDFGNLFHSFQGGRYKLTARIMFAKYLQIFLYSLLLIIPGIIKMYEYFLVPYIAAENPYLDKKRVLEISKKTMEGEKMSLLLLQCSFIGWYILGIIFCYIGIIFVHPYYEATMAEFYACMRAKMISMYITTDEELTGNFDNLHNNQAFYTYGTNPYSNYQNNYNGYPPQNQNAAPNMNQNYQNPQSFNNDTSAAPYGQQQTPPTMESVNLEKDTQNYQNPYDDTNHQNPDNPF